MEFVGQGGTVPLLHIRNYNGPFPATVELAELSGCASTCTKNSPQPRVRHRRRALRPCSRGPSIRTCLSRRGSFVAPGRPRLASASSSASIGTAVDLSTLDDINMFGCAQHARGGWCQLHLSETDERAVGVRCLRSGVSQSYKLVVKSLNVVVQLSTLELGMAYLEEIVDAELNAARRRGRCSGHRGPEGVRPTKQPRQAAASSVLLDIDENARRGSCRRPPARAGGRFRPTADRRVAGRAGLVEPRAPNRRRS